MPYRLSRILAALIVVQSTLGLVFPQHYRDVDWIKATWFGNDWVTLILAAPLLLIALVMTGRGSVRGQMMWLGLVGYCAYNYAFYLLGAALNAFFLLYVLAVVLSVVILIRALSRLDVAEASARFRATTPVKLIGGYLVCVGCGLAAIWITIWATYVFAGRPTPVEPEVFKLVAALDLSLMVPGLTFGGVLLWRRHAWGYVIAVIAAMQASLYLVVLSVNAMVAVWRGLAAAPGELPMWGTLAALTGVVALVLLASIRTEHSRL